MLADLRTVESITARAVRSSQGSAEVALGDEQPGVRGPHARGGAAD